MGVARIGREDQLMVSASLRELAHGGIDMGPPLHSLVRAPKACGIEGNRAGSRAIVRDREQSCGIESNRARSRRVPGLPGDQLLSAFPSGQCSKPPAHCTESTRRRLCFFLMGSVGLAPSSGSRLFL